MTVEHPPVSRLLSVVIIDDRPDDIPRDRDEVG
jgi:hypothetical protein